MDGDDGRVAALRLPVCVPDLYLYRDFFSPSEQKQLLARIDKTRWMAVPGSGENGRVVQQYGPRFDYDTWGLSPALDPLPKKELPMLFSKLELAKTIPASSVPTCAAASSDSRPSSETPFGVPAHGHGTTMIPEEFVPDQMIINNYVPGQGIRAHVDATQVFGPTIVTISLGSPCEMTFRHLEDGRTASVELMPGDLMVMTGEARYKWSHRIDVQRRCGSPVRLNLEGRRVSLTLRQTVVPTRDGEVVGQAKREKDPVESVRLLRQRPPRVARARSRWGNGLAGADLHVVATILVSLVTGILYERLTRLP